MGKHYEEINLEDLEVKTDEEEATGKTTEEKMDAIDRENEGIGSVAFSIVAVCSTIIAGTIVATVSLL